MKEAARSAIVEGDLDATGPGPGFGGANRPSTRRAIAMTNPDLKSQLWGPAHRVTLSMLKTDVQDRRVKWPDHVITLDEITRGAFAEVNQADVPRRNHTTRPVQGYLSPTGGRVDPYVENWHAYPFPCQKPVGQIILMQDDLQGAPQPELKQSCASGLVNFQIEKGDVRSKVEILLSPTTNVYALRVSATGLKAGMALRLYRHQDQGHLRYMSSNGKFHDSVPADSAKATGPGLSIGGKEVRYDYERDASWNGPIEPPESGRDGRYFWIAQRMPAEKTFPSGFQYVMMGLVVHPDVDIKTVAGQRGLGTPPLDEDIANAPGSAATATVQANGPEKITAYVVVVTEIDAPNFMVEARRRIAEAEAKGFDAIVHESAAWYDALYDKRESGRVFYGNAGTSVTEDVETVYKSWYCRHGGGCKPDMRRYQGTASYSRLESDWQPWHGYPCYNEWFYTPSYVRNRSDAVDMWKYLIEHWADASRANAENVFGKLGIAFLHGYLPPVKADRYVHTNAVLELSFSTLGQVFRCFWDEWDYGGDHRTLENSYAYLRDMADFYGSYFQKGDDGHYHAIPSIEAECWGIYPKLLRSIDATGTLCMARWALHAASDAAEILDKDAGSRARWRDIARQIAPYPKWRKPEGEVFAGVRGVEPFWFPGDHPFYEGVFPTTLAGDVNLDSSREEKATMLRTARLVPAGPNAEALVLLGDCPETAANVSTAAQPIPDWQHLRQEVDRYPERLINSRSGRIHLFPCVPAKSAVAFRRFQARGGFLVSAARNEAGVYFVEIEARRNSKCSLMNPWPEAQLTLRTGQANRPHPLRVDRRNGECLVFEAIAGSSYRIDRRDLV